MNLLQLENIKWISLQHLANAKQSKGAAPLPWIIQCWVTGFSTCAWCSKLPTDGPGLALTLRNLSFPFSAASILYSRQICMVPPRRWPNPHYHPCPFFVCDDLLLEWLFSSSEPVLPPYKQGLPFVSLKKNFYTWTLTHRICLFVLQLLLAVLGLWC